MLGAVVTAYIFFLGKTYVLLLKISTGSCAVYIVSITQYLLHFEWKIWEKCLKSASAYGVFSEPAERYRYSTKSLLIIIAPPALATWGQRPEALFLDVSMECHNPQTGV